MRARITGKTRKGGGRNHGETTFNYGDRGVARNVAAKEGEKGSARHGSEDASRMFSITFAPLPTRCLITPRCREPRLPRNALAVLMPLLVRSPLPSPSSSSSHKSAREF